MFDTMTFTKVLGGFCGALLIFLLAGYGAENLYHTGPKGHGEDHVQGYVIEVEDDGADAAEDEGPDLLTLIAQAEIDKGERVYGKCRACHKLEDGANGTGPHLFNTVNRDKGSIDGFTYSSAMAEMPGNWGYVELDAFLEDPKGYVRGTKMSFSGLKKIEDRANLIAYLETIQ
ncbi:c-type cytochrome [Planktotalea arctica]|uniref:c-type cytochrome n=2 Tax=Planktotalea arctica TaxID=1481893 RepID=UPI000A1774EA|nr:cytochrome c family protein [Planktotalea arctica]